MESWISLCYLFDLSIFLNFSSVLVSLIQKMVITNLIELQRLNESTSEKCLEPYLVYSNCYRLIRRRRSHPTPVLLPGESHGRSLPGSVHGVAKSRTRLSNFTFTFHFLSLEKEMATHSSVLAWRIPGKAEPGGLPSMGSHRSGHD